MNENAPRRYIGESVTRLEDRRHLRGEANFVDDVTVPNIVAMAILRSPLAHARIHDIDLAAARAAPGVLDAAARVDAVAAAAPCDAPGLLAYNTDEVETTTI